MPETLLKWCQAGEVEHWSYILRPVGSADKTVYPIPFEEALPCSVADGCWDTTDTPHVACYQKTISTEVDTFAITLRAHNTTLEFPDSDFSNWRVVPEAGFSAMLLAGLTILMLLHGRRKRNKDDKIQTPTVRPRDRRSA